MNPIPDRLPSRPLRNWFLAWHVHTGDPPDVMAKGFDLPAELVGELLAKRPPLMLESAVALDVCTRIRADASTLFGCGLVPRVGTPSETDPLWEDLPAEIARLFSCQETSPSPD